MQREQVPWRTIIASIGSVLVTAALVAIVFIAAQVLLWIAMAALLALILAPPVDRIETRLRCRRAIAVVLVMMTAAIGVSAVAFVIVRPVVTQWTTISTKVPDLLDEARAGIPFPVDGLDALAPDGATHVNNVHKSRAGAPVKG